MSRSDRLVLTLLLAAGVFQLTYLHYALKGAAPFFYLPESGRWSLVRPIHEISMLWYGWLAMGTLTGGLAGGAAWAVLGKFEAGAKQLTLGTLGLFLAAGGYVFALGLILLATALF